MGVATPSFSWAHGSDAQLRAWGGAVSAALDAIGLAKTADTGQVDWSTVTRAAANTLCGYEIRTLTADTQNATAPLVFRIEYWTAGGVSTPSIRIGVGKGSDGAGALTSTLVSASSCAIDTGSTTANANPAATSYFSAGDGYIVIQFAPGLVGSTTVLTGGFIFERSRDEDGAPTPDGFLFGASAYRGNSGYPYIYGVNYAAGSSWARDRLQGSFPGFLNGASPNLTQSWSHDGVTEPVFPFTGFAPNVPAWTLLSAVGIAPAGGTNPVIELYGSPRSYVHPLPGDIGTTYNGHLAVTHHAGSIGAALTVAQLWEV